jgi:DNA mismatch repair protein MutS
MQVGSFHECYCTDTDGLDLMNIADKLDIICTKKNGKEPVSKSNPRMLGFPIYVTSNYIEKLSNLNYTIVKIDQTSEPPKPKREVTAIISPGTFIETTSSTTHIVSIILEKITKTNLLSIGLAAYDLTTGYGSFYETYSTIHDPMLALDDSLRYLETCPPKEIIIYHNLDHNELINNMKLNDILLYLQLNESNTLFYNVNKTNKVSYQKLLFEKIFKNESNIFEFLHLHLYNLARFALTNLLEYVQNQQPHLIEKLKIPEEFENNKTLYLGNRALEQLNVISNKSLFQIINFTKTSMGKRFLFYSLTKPLIKKSDIDQRINLINQIIEKNIYENIINYLEDINDLDRLIRRLEINIIHPFEINNLYVSFYQIHKLINYLESNNLFDFFDKDNKKIKIGEFLDYINTNFYLDKISNINFNNYYESSISFIKPNIYSEIDLLQEKIISSNNFMDNLLNSLNLLIDDKKIFIKKDTESDTALLSLKYNERDGHYFLITNRRCQILQTNLEKLKEIKVGSIILKKDELEFEKLPKSNNTKINCKKIKEISNILVVHKNELAKLLKEKFKEQIIFISNKYSDILNYWSNKVAFIDFINSGAKCAIKNHYTKPIIVENGESYFRASNIRHPIVEYINSEIEYKPHNIELGGPNGLNGILLYGINSSGKSTLMKSIGLNVILSQIGYYTATDSFEIAPYKSLFTRIGGSDNIYRGLSSFMVEMMELTSILKRNNCNTLVIGDEVCSTTESRSSNIIVAYMLKKLSESKSSFITATHLHELTNLNTVKNLKNVKTKHLKLTYDDINDCLIYNRELLDGQGESFYGLQVAKYLMKDTYFNEITNNILNEYDNLNIKQSKYNPNNYLIECHICKSKENLETHHIVFQKDFDDKLINKNKIHYQKDANYNLVTLCQSCHDDVDREIIIINGWIETNKGRELDYFKQEKIEKKSKYSNEIIEYIKTLKNEFNSEFARIKIKEKFNKKITKKTIESLWDN